jgi:ferredoxin
MPTAAAELDGQLVEVEIKESDILYDTFEEAGHDLPHGCLSGSCGACKVEVIEGSESLSDPTTIEKDTLQSISDTLKSEKGEAFLEGKHLRLSCRTKYKGTGNIKIKPI